MTYLPEFTFDYSFLDLQELGDQCISVQEIENVFYNQSQFYDYSDTEYFIYVIGYSFRNKFISFTFNESEGIIRILSVYLSYEQEIKNRYFTI